MISKNKSDITDFDFAAGKVILIDKEIGFTSFDIIAKLRKILNIKKIGHAGTLDPLATGLLIICTGKKTKEIYKYQNLDKRYSGVITLGKVTPSLDAGSEFIENNSIDGITNEMIYNTRDFFIGTISQIPPMFSAIKHKGKALYKYARKGIEIEREPREVTISKFEITKIELPEIHFDILCTKGTYIRAIAGDFGSKLGCGAYLSSLRRNAIGEFSVEDAFSIDEFARFVSGY